MPLALRLGNAFSRCADLKVGTCRAKARRYHFVVPLIGDDFGPSEHLGGLES